MTVLLDLAIIGVLCGLGWLARRAVAPRLYSCDDLALAFPLGAGLYAWMLFLISWAGLALRPVTLAVVLLGLGAGLLAFGRARAARAALVSAAEVAPPAPAGRGGADWAVLALTGGLTLVAAVLAVGTAYSAWDAIAIWGVKGYGIALEGTVLAGARWGAHGLAYPLNVPLLIAVFRQLTGDVLPGSKLVFAAFYGASLFAALAFWRRQGVPPVHALAGVALVGTTPLAFRHAYIGYANLPLACYLVLGTVYGAEALERRDRSLAVLAGVLFGLAAWTRPEGIVLALSAAAALLLTARERVGLPLRAAALLVPMTAIAVPWLAFMRLYGARSQIASALSEAAAAIAAGRWNLGGVAEILRFAADSSVEIEIWGPLVPAAVLLLLIRRPPREILLRGPLAAQWTAALALAAGVAGLYYVATFSGPGTDWWLMSGFNRMLIPCALLAGLFIVGLSGREGDRSPAYG